MGGNNSSMKERGRRQDKRQEERKGRKGEKYFKVFLLYYRTPLRHKAHFIIGLLITFKH